MNAKEKKIVKIMTLIVKSAQTTIELVRCVVFMGIKENLVTQKFRFDLGVSFLTIINLSLLSITASDKIQTLLNKIGINFNLYFVIGLIIILSLVGTWSFGYLLDKRFKYWQQMKSIQNKRDPQINEILHNTRRIMGKMK